MDIAVVGAGINLTLDDDGTCTAAAGGARRRSADNRCWLPKQRTH